MVYNSQQLSLMKSARKPWRGKALIAVLFAGGVLNSPLTALAESKVDSANSVIERIANNAQATPEIRAYRLLSLATGYLKGGSKEVTEAQFEFAANEPNNKSFFNNPRGGQNILRSWADQISFEVRSKSGTKTKTDTKSKLQRLTAEESVLANTAIKEALTLLDQTTDKFAKLNMYFIASCLYQQLGNTDGMQKCNQVLEKAFAACEGKLTADNEEIRATSSILNSMSFGLAPLYIADSQPPRQISASPVTESDFKASEKLKLRAVAFADRLPETEHVRRKAHRDLALWYMEFGKVNLAQKQKEILFDLVDCMDDRILYPNSVGCGQLIWWQKEAPLSSRACGMG